MTSAAFRFNVDELVRIIGSPIIYFVVERGVCCDGTDIYYRLDRQTPPSDPDEVYSKPTMHERKLEPVD